MAATSFPWSNDGILVAGPWPNAIFADTGSHRAADGLATDGWRQFRSVAETCERGEQTGQIDRGWSGSGWDHAVLHVSVGIRPSRRISGPIQFVHKLLKTWKLDRRNAGALLGFGESEAREVLDILEGRAEIRGRDIKDRIASLYQIRKILHSLFQDENVENEWLRERHVELHNQRPMELLLEGSMENILYVRDYVEAAAGL